MIETEELIAWAARLWGDDEREEFIDHIGAATLAMIKEKLDAHHKAQARRR